MANLKIFIIRAVFGAVFAVLLARFFHPEMSLLYVAGLTVFLVGMSYLFEALRRKKKHQ